MLIHICSYPRSGNSFFTNTLLCFDKVWEVDGKPMEFTPSEKIYGGALRLLSPDMPLDTVPANSDPMALEENSERVFVFKQHVEPHRLDNGKVIGIIRDGRDCMVSYANMDHTLRDTVPEAERHHYDSVDKRLDARIQEESGYSWSTHVWSVLNSKNVNAVVRYENMHKDPVKVVAHALSLCGVVVSQARDPIPFKKLHERDGWFYRKGKPQDWKNEMPAEYVKKFESLHSAVLRYAGY